MLKSSDAAVDRLGSQPQPLGDLNVEHLPKSAKLAVLPPLIATKIKRDGFHIAREFP